MKRWLAASLLLAASALHAATWHGTVTHVSDGDTLWVRPAGGGAPIPIRLLDVDAPETCQPFGPQARDALRSRVLGERVRVRSRGDDQYGRKLAHIEHRREDVGRWLVRQGYAWSMRFHRRSGPYAALEVQARREHQGLWSHPGAMEPRSFRQRHGHCE
jgi:endonuclease YncB( thermonuclease family)